MRHDVCLNIHYSAPKEIWEKISVVYRSMPYWCNDSYPHWVGDNIDISVSVEPDGIQIYGEMPDELWAPWYETLKKNLSEALGYEIGEPENAYKFKFWEPFCKIYSDTKILTANRLFLLIIQLSVRICLKSLNVILQQIRHFLLSNPL